MALDDILPGNNLGSPEVTEIYKLGEFNKDDLSFRSVRPIPSLPSSVGIGEAYGVVVRDMLNKVVRKYISFRDSLDGGCDVVPTLQVVEYDTKNS